MRIALASTIHDIEGRLTPAIAHSAAMLRTVFADIALNITDATAPAVAQAARRHLNARTIQHPQGAAIIGRARRDAVGLALEGPADAILYCDFDHMLRWADADAAELRATLQAQPEAELLVVGRTDAALAAEPARLRETERLVNHIYALTTGRAWDLMFAIRRLSRRAAETIVSRARVDSIANDVEWPLLLERAGFTLGYARAHGLYYRAMDDFGATADTHDGDPLEWIRRIDIAALHADVLRAFLEKL